MNPSIKLLRPKSSPTRRTRRAHHEILVTL